MGTFDILTPPFCAGGTSNYLLGTVAPITVPITLLPGADSFSVDFPADTNLAGVTAAGVTVTGVAPHAFPASNPAAITVVGQHLEFVIPAAWLATNPVVPAGQTITITVNAVVNPTVADTYCLYIDYVESCGSPSGCAAVQFACEEFVVSPAVKDIGCHFDFGLTYAGIAEDYIPPFKACGDPIWGFAVAPGFATRFDFIVRDENGGCTNPCADPPMGFWWEVTKCPAGAQIWVDDGTVGAPYTVTAADIGVTKYSMLSIWTVFPTAPVDQLYPIDIHFDTPGEYELQWFIQCPTAPCPTCAGPTVITTCALPAKVYQFFDATKIDIEEKWDLISLPLFPYDTSIASVMGAMDRLDQLVSAWHFSQCEDPAPDVGVWHSSAYTGGAFVGDLTDIRTGPSYWIRTLHLGETGYVAGPNGLWVFGTHAIMPDPTGMDMGYFDVCEGWNMVGHKPPWAFGLPVAGQPDNLYLWNFNGFGQVNYGLIYDWMSLPLPGDWATWAPGALAMTPGFGYWIPFDGDSEIYPSA
jgi:hypothetical protein